MLAEMGELVRESLGRGAVVTTSGSVASDEHAIGTDRVDSTRTIGACP